MSASSSPTIWNSLEIVKLFVASLTPLMVLVLTLIINRRTKEAERKREQWERLGEKRMELYDRLGVKINEVFCYFWYVGRWKEFTPGDVLKCKRELDSIIHTYKPFFSAEFHGLYRSFIEAAFAEYAVPGEDAKLRTTLRSRAAYFANDWDAKWDQLLTNEDNSKNVVLAYEALLARLAAELDLASAPVNKT